MEVERVGNGSRMMYRNGQPPKTIFDVMQQDNCEQALEEATARVAKVHKDQPELYRSADELVTRLGLGGFWKGWTLAMDVVISEIQKWEVI